MSRRLPLSDVALGGAGRVAEIALEPREADWLRAVGLFEGSHVVVLRRAPFGGPLHLRTGSGAEFAVDRDLARAVALELSAEDAARASG